MIMNIEKHMLMNYESRTKEWQESWISKLKFFRFNAQRGERKSIRDPERFEQARTNLRLRIYCMPTSWERNVLNGAFKLTKETPEQIDLPILDPLTVVTDMFVQQGCF